MYSELTSSTMATVTTFDQFRPDPNDDPVEYLRSLYAVRDRAKAAIKKADLNQLNHFYVDTSKLDGVVTAIMKAIKDDYDNDPSRIPPHGRWEHFLVDDRERLNKLIQSWTTAGIDSSEQCRRLLDLTVVSVLLDAGAGPTWKYVSEQTGETVTRSEGLAIGSFDMFIKGAFSSDKSAKVDAAGLKALTTADVAKGLQVSDDNVLAGLEGRAGLLIKLGDALAENSEFFGPDGRPGAMLDYFLKNSTDRKIHAAQVWNVLMKGLLPIWPQGRVSLNGASLGDAWECSLVDVAPGDKTGKIVPFHKLTQWLCYSLFRPLSEPSLGNMTIEHTTLLTGLPEYRNGGLLVDHGVLAMNMKDDVRGRDRVWKEAGKTGLSDSSTIPLFDADDDVIVEWRVVTIGMLDKVYILVNERLESLGQKPLTLQQVLEAGTWKCGRIIAKEKRASGGPPIDIKSDGTVF